MKLASLQEMNRLEKEEYVIRLYKENKSTREIAKLTHMSFRDIGAITKKLKLEADGKKGPLEEDDNIKSKSKTTQAIKLFSEHKTPVEVAIALDLSVGEVQSIYQEYWKLAGMYKLAQVHEEAKYDLDDLLGLHRMVKGLGMNKQDIINVLDLVKYNQLQYLQSKAENLRNHIDMLEMEKTNSLCHIFKLKMTIHDLQSSLAQKRREMAHMNQESGKCDTMYPITHSESDTNSHSASGP